MINDDSNINNQNNFFEKTEKVIDVADLLKTFWHKKILILFTFIVSFLCFLFIISLITPQYTAQATIVIKDSAENLLFANTPKLTQRNNLDKSKLKTEIEILKSRPIALDVIDKLNLTNDPEFKSNDNTDHNHDPVLESIEADFLEFSFNGTDLEEVKPKIFDPITMNAVDIFLKNLKIHSIKDSSAVTINYTSTNPKKSAFIVNTLIKVYDERRVSQQSKSKDKLKRWIDMRHETLKEELNKAELALEEFKKTNKEIPENTFVDFSKTTIQKLVQDLNIAEQKRIELETKLKSINNVNSAWGLNTKDIDNHLTRNLRHQESKLEITLSELSERYGPKHPKMIKTQAEVTALERLIRSEKEKVTKAYKTDLKIIKSKIKEITNLLGNAPQSNTGGNIDTNLFIELKENVNIARGALKKFIDSQNISIDETSEKETQIEIISNASIPKSISYPHKTLFTTLAAFVSLFISLGISLLVENMTRSIRKEEDITRNFNLDLYASIPKLRALKKLPIAKDYLLENPSSAITESIHSTLVDLKAKKIQSNNKNAQIISIASADQNDGKTLIASWIGILSAKSEEKTLLIDGNLRKPSIHTAFDIDNHKSLIKFLNGTCELKDVIYQDTSSGLDIITAENTIDHAYDLLNSKKMKSLIKDLSQSYDLIIIDTPHTNQYADAKLLSQYASNIIYIVNSHKTDKHALTKSVQNLKKFLKKDIGFILNRTRS